MKIVYVSYSIIPSKSANSVHVIKMCQALAANAMEVILIAPDKKEEYEPKKVKDLYSHYGVTNSFQIKKLPHWGLKALPFSVFILWFLLRHGNHFVYGRFVVGCLLASLLGRPTIFELHEPIWRYSFLHRMPLKLMLRKKSFVKLIVISEALKQLCLQELGIEEKKIFVAHDGSDEIPETNHQLNPGDRLQVGYIGSLYKGRGIDLIMECANVLDNVDFHIVGGNTDEVEFWKKEATARNLHFHGYVPPSKTSEYLNACDVLLAPYQKKLATQGGADTSKFMSPLKIFEYMASGKAIIASDLSVLREVLNENNAVLVDASNYHEWVNAIRALQDPDKRRALGNQAKADFIANYTWQKRAENIKRIFESVE